MDTKQPKEQDWYRNHLITNKDEIDKLPTLKQSFYQFRAMPEMAGVTMISSEGIVRFYCGDDLASDEIAIHYITIRPELRRKGIFTSLLKCIMEHKEYRRVIVLGLSNAIIENCLKKFEHNGIKFINHGGDGIWARDRKYCKCCQ